MEHLEETLESINNVGETPTQAVFDTVLNSQSCSRILYLFNVYLTFLHDGGNGNIAAFWMTYLNMVDIMFGLIRAAREGDWSLYLSSFTYDKINYARYLTVYYAQMMHLEQNHPGVHANMTSSGFSVQLGSQNPFGKIPADQAIEETVNKDTQT